MTPIPPDRNRKRLWLCHCQNCSSERRAQVTTSVPQWTVTMHKSPPQYHSGQSRCASHHHLSTTVDSHGAQVTTSVPQWTVTMHKSPPQYHSGQSRCASHHHLSTTVDSHGAQVTTTSVPQWTVTVHKSPPQYHSGQSRCASHHHLSTTVDSHGAQITTSVPQWTVTVRKSPPPQYHSGQSRCSGCVTLVRFSQMSWLDLVSPQVWNTWSPWLLSAAELSAFRMSAQLYPMILVGLLATHTVSAAGRSCVNCWKEKLLWTTATAAPATKQQ